MRTLFQATKYKLLELCIDYIFEKIKTNFSDSDQLLKVGKYYSMIEAPYTTMKDGQVHYGVFYFDCAITNIGTGSFMFNYGSYLLKDEYVGMRGYHEEGEGGSVSFPLYFINSRHIILSP